jgi:hypothetical protein
MRIRMQLYSSMQIRIQETKPMLIKADPNPEQTFESQIVEFSHEKYTYLK